MNKLDKTIRTNLIAQSPKMTEETSRHFDDTLMSLSSSDDKHKSSSHMHTHTFYMIRRTCAGFVCAIAAVFLVVVVLVNVNKNVAYAMQDIPIIGNLIKVVTVNKKDVANEYHYEDINVPQIESQEGLEESIDYINADIKELTDAVIEQFEKDAEALPDSHFGLSIDYETVTNNENWFTLKLILHYAAGSTSTDYQFYHIDKKAGKIVKLSDLFNDEYDYVTDISNEIIRQMNDQMDKDSSKSYWVKREGKENFYEFENIDPEQNFYFSDNGNIVIVFEKYEVAPGYMGSCEFEIPKEIYQAHMK